MKQQFISIALLTISLAGLAQRQKTTFQASSQWIPQIDVRSDMAIVYGTDNRKGVTFEQRVQSWRDHGYQIAFMTGIAWGTYFDYFLGKSHAKAGALILRNSFYLERGPYDIISVLDENADQAPYMVKGPVIDLFDASLPVLDQKTVSPGDQSLLFDLGRVADKQKPQVLASASRNYEEKADHNNYSFVAKSPVNTQNSIRVLLPAQPSGVVVTDSKGQPVSDLQSSWDEGSHTEYLGFSNSPDGVKVSLKW